MRTQIEDYLINNNLVTQINYLVTTKGCPLRIIRDETGTQTCSASVESELTLLIGQYKGMIGNCGWVDNPYLSETNNFSFSDYQIFLVTRLDAYTKEEVFNLIDRSGPNTYVNKDSVLFVLMPHRSGRHINLCLMIFMTFQKFFIRVVGKLLTIQIACMSLIKKM